jgi:hypothetical protein
MKIPSILLSLLLLPVTASAQESINATCVDDGDFTWTTGLTPDSMSENPWEFVPGTDSDAIDTNGYLKAVASMHGKWLEAVVSGPGTLAFKISTKASVGGCGVTLNGTGVLTILADSPWTTYSMEIPSGTNAVRWNVAPPSNLQYAIARLDQVKLTASSTFSLNLTQTTGGHIDASPSGTAFAPGTAVTVTATAYTGYTFAGWKGTFTSTSNPLRFTMDRTVEVIPVFLKTVSGSAVEAPQLSFFTSAEGGWKESTTRASKGGTCLTNQANMKDCSRLWCRLNGPATLSFDLYISNYYLKVFLDDTSLSSWSVVSTRPGEPEASWRTSTIDIPGGSHTLEFRAGNVSFMAGNEDVFIDNVTCRRPSFYENILSQTDDGYSHLGKIGWVYDANYPWVYSYDNGWIWVHDAEVGYVWWDCDTSAWYWSSANAYPYAYLYGEGWVWLGDRAGSRRIYHYEGNRWQNVP